MPCARSMKKRIGGHWSRLQFRDSSSGAKSHEGGEQFTQVARAAPVYPNRGEESAMKTSRNVAVSAAAGSAAIAAAFLTSHHGVVWGVVGGVIVGAVVGL